MLQALLVAYFLFKSSAYMMASISADKDGSTGYKRVDLYRPWKAPELNGPERLKVLSDMLSNPMFSHQKKNIEAAIAKYKTGAVPTMSAPWWFVDGKFCAEEPDPQRLSRDRPALVEVHFLSH